MLTCDKGQKHLAFPKYWQKAQVDTCVAEFLRSDDNALALLTGDKSDIIALDVDVAKQEDVRLGRADGMQVFKDLIDKHGLPASTPVSQTATGGLHYISRSPRALLQAQQSDQATSKWPRKHSRHQVRSLCA